MFSFTQEIPNQFLCPITLEIMGDPVICQDGYTYERKSILDLVNSLSPMTREPIDKNKLIPNLAIKQLIKAYIDKNGIKLNRTTNAETKAIAQPETRNSQLEELRRERIGVLERFEREQKEKEQARIEAIQKEKQEQNRKYKEEAEKKRKLEQERKELQRVVNMFNSRDLPILHSGWYKWIGNGVPGMTWHSYTDKKFEFNTEHLSKIKQCNENELLVQYKKLCEDIIWIKKYVYGLKNTKPFVDYVYDFWNNEDKLNDIINKLKIKINDGTQRCSGHKYGTYSNYSPRNDNGRLNRCGNCENKLVIESELKHYTDLKNKLHHLNKPREYYYVNHEEFLKIFKRELNYNCGAILLDSFHDVKFDHLTYGVGNEEFYNIYYIWDREKYDKINFLINICEYIGLIKYTRGCANIWCCGLYFNDPVLRNKNYEGTHEFILDHIQYILSRNNNHNIGRRMQFVNSSDFDDLMKIGLLIVELIEFVRPEVIL